MCAPVAAVVSVVGTVASIAATTASTVMQVEGQRKQAEEAERQARRNAALAEQQGRDELVRGALKAGEARRAGRQAEASSVAAVAGAGESTTRGTLSNIFAVSRLNAELDAQNIEASAHRRAWQYEEEGGEHLRQGRHAREAGFMGALGTGIAGAGRIAAQGAAGFETAYGHYKAAT